MKRLAALALSVALLVAVSQTARAEKLRIGTPEAVGFNFYMLNAGIELGIFKKYDLDIERIDLEGGAKLHQAMIAGSIDIALGGGTDLLFLVKGSPEKAVAVLGTSPANFAILVRRDSRIHGIADLKGAKIGATTVGSMTSWFALDIAQREGWGDNGVTIVYLGGNEALFAGLTTKAVDAVSGSLEIGHIRASENKYRMIVKGGDYVQEFIASVIFASDATIAQRPDALRRFLKGWFETVRYLRDHKAEAVPLMAKIMNAPPDAVGKIYDDEMTSFPVDGHFDPQALQVVERALVDLHRIDRIPDNKALIDESFLP